METMARMGQASASLQIPGLLWTQLQRLGGSPQRKQPTQRVCWLLVSCWFTLAVSDGKKGQVSNASPKCRVCSCVALDHAMRVCGFANLIPAHRKTSRRPSSRTAQMLHLEWHCRIAMDGAQVLRPLCQELESRLNFEKGKKKQEDKSGVKLKLPEFSCNSFHVFSSLMVV